MCVKREGILIRVFTPRSGNVIHSNLVLLNFLLTGKKETNCKKKHEGQKKSTKPNETETKSCIRFLLVLFGCI